MVKAVDIELLGRKYRVSCPQDEEESLLAARERLETKMLELKQNTKVGNMERLAVIAALNFSYELGEELKRNSDYTSSVDQKIKTLQSTIEQALLEQGLLEDSSK